MARLIALVVAHQLVGVAAIAAGFALSAVLGLAWTTVARARAVVLSTFEGLLAEIAAARIVHMTLRHDILGATPTTLVHQHKALGTFLFIVAVVRHGVVAVVFPCAWQRTIRWLGATRDWREEDSSTTVTCQFIKRGFQTGRALSSVTFLLAAVSLADQRATTGDLTGMSFPTNLVHGTTSGIAPMPTTEALVLAFSFTQQLNRLSCPGSVKIRARHLHF